MLWLYHDHIIFEQTIIKIYQSFKYLTPYKIPYTITKVCTNFTVIFKMGMIMDKYNIFSFKLYKIKTYHHRTPGVSAQGPGPIPDGRPRGLSPGWKGGSPPPERRQGDGVTGDDHRQGPGRSHPSAETGDQNRGLANGAAIHGEWDRAGSAGVAGCRLPALWPRATRPPNSL